MCYLSTEYFINEYCYIYDTVSTDWILFRLWPAQKRVLKTFIEGKKVVVLKARQEGITWLALAYILWDAIFKSPSTALFMSKRDDEAVAALSTLRLRGMFNRLPDWLKPSVIGANDAHLFSFGHDKKNLSSIRALSTKAGDSYTATVAVIDEADLMDDLQKILLSIEPTINAGGKLILISKADRSKPLSLFKQIYKAAKAGETGYLAEFVAWNEHPGRDISWYERQKETILQTEGSLDSLYESYPATDTEALSLQTSDRRFPFEFIERVITQADKVELDLVIPNCVFYQKVDPTQQYTIGCDCAEGLRTGDYSVSTVINHNTGDIAAVLRGKIPPDIHAMYTKQLSDYYNQALVLPERNNHGHLFIATALSNGLSIMPGSDGKPGYFQTNTSKVILLDDSAKRIADGQCILNDPLTATEVGSIESATLKAPESMHDDLAMAWFLANWCRRYVPDLRYDRGNPFGINDRDW